MAAFFQDFPEKVNWRPQYDHIHESHCQNNRQIGNGNEFIKELVDPKALLFCI
jgi:hypothetical protein